MPRLTDRFLRWMNPCRPYDAPLDKTLAPEQLDRLRTGVEKMERYQEQAEALRPKALAVIETLTLIEARSTYLLFWASDASYHLARHDWEALGRPDQISVTVRPHAPATSPEPGR